MKAYFLSALIHAVVGVIEALIAGRILLKFLGASQAAPFVRWVYETSQPLIKPFVGMFPTPGIEGGFVLEFSALFAIVAYAVGGYLLIEVIRLVHIGIDETERSGKKK